MRFVLSIFCIAMLGASSKIPLHLQQAEEIAQQIDASDNEYAHKDCFIHWKGEGGALRYENRTDCSDFVDLLLEHAYHLTPAKMQQWTGRSRPLAETWYDTIAAHNYFQIISTVADIKPGDVIAIRFPPGAGDTGHIMLAAGKPTRRSATPPLERDLVQWELPVIDSSKSGHGPTDRRNEGGGSAHTGIGQGIFRFYTDNSGHIAGYAWSTVSASKFEPSSERKVLVGRLQVPQD